MYNLIINELSKIFHKKAFYITLLVSTLLIVLISFLTIKTSSMGEHFVFEVKTGQIGENEEDKKMLADMYAQNEYNKLGNKYMNSWKKEIVSDYSEELYQYYYDIEMTKQNKTLEKVDDTAFKKFEEDLKLDYKTYINRKIKEVEMMPVPDKAKEPLLYEYRYKLDNSLDKKENASLLRDLNDYTNTKSYYDSLSSKEKKENQEALANLKVLKYRLDKKIKSDDPHMFKDNISNFLKNYSLFFLIIISILSGYSIAEEFSKGTIKLLLIRPYERYKIFFAKLISVFISFIVFIVSLYIINLIIGSIFYGTGPLSETVQVYDFKLDKVREFSVFKLSMINLLASLPVFIFLMLASFVIGSISESSGFGITSVFGLNIIMAMLGQLIQLSKFKFLTIIPSYHWNFEQYLFGGTNSINEVFKTNYNFSKSLIIYLVYIILLYLIGVINFKKKDVKNI